MIHKRHQGKKSQCTHNCYYEIIILMMKNIYSYNQRKYPRNKRKHESID